MMMMVMMMKMKKKKMMIDIFACAVVFPVPFLSAAYVTVFSCEQ